MKTQFTPGPWLVDDDSNAVGPVVSNGKGTPIAVCDALKICFSSGQCVRVPKPEAAANAHLIAAAPELLEALLLIINSNSQEPPYKEPWEERRATYLAALANANAVIAKATGGSQ